MTCLRSYLPVLCFTCLLPALGAVQVQGELWINEFHYNNTGTDVNEFVEIVITQSNFTDPNLGDIVVELYDSATGLTYDSITLADPSISVTSDGFANYYIWNPTEIRDQAGNGIALNQGVFTIQFSSYGGTTSALDGFAAGSTSVDVGFIQSESTPVGESIGLVGLGQSFSEFSWSAPMGQTNGSINEGQSFFAVPEPGSFAILAIGATVFGLRRRRST